MAKYEKGSFITLPNKQILRGRKPALQSVYIWICEHADEKGLCFPSIPTLATESGCSVRNVQYAISELEDLDILHKIPQKQKKKNFTNQYQILIVETDGVVQDMHQSGAGGTPLVVQEVHTNSIHTELNPSNSSSDDALRAMTPAELAKEFFISKTAQEALIESLVKVGVMRQAAEIEIQKFIDYWTELNSTGKRQRWQLEKTFELRKRMATWFRNANMRKTNSHKRERIIA